MIRTFLSVIAIALTFMASFFLIRGNLVVSAKDIAELFLTKLGYNPDAVLHFARQYADTKIGFVILLIALVIQLINVSWPLRIKDFGVSRDGVLIALAVALITFVIADRISSEVQIKTNNLILKSIEERLSK